MKVLRLGVLIGSMFMAQLAVADAESEKAAESLFVSMKLEEVMVQSMSQMVDLQLQQNPALAPYKPVMLKFMGKYMSWERLKPEFLTIYSEAFTAQELREINDFYVTDTGQKSVQLMPTLMAQGGQIGAALVQENIGELQAMIKAEAERLAKLDESKN